MWKSLLELSLTCMSMTLSVKKSFIDLPCYSKPLVISMPGEFGITDVALAFAMGAIIVYMYWSTTRKKWFLESMNPRNEYELGREKKLLVNLKILERTFNGVKAGSYTLLLTHGSLSEYSKSIFYGKIEHIYSTVLADALVRKKIVHEVEKKQFFSFLYERLPELAVRGHLITGELISPDKVVDGNWTSEGDRIKAYEELAARKLLTPRTLWVRPYPPEDQLQDILSGAIQIPDILEETMKDREEVTRTYRETIIQINRGASKLLSEFIPLARLIITSISDPTFVMALILSERASQVRGIGLTQLAERGGIEGMIEAARQLVSKRDELLKVLGPPMTKEETERIKNLETTVQELKKALQGFEKRKAEVVPPPMQGA